MKLRETNFRDIFAFQRKYKKSHFVQTLLWWQESWVCRVTPAVRPRHQDKQTDGSGAHHTQQSKNKAPQVRDTGNLINTSATSVALSFSLALALTRISRVEM
jgi:hypothetical protein